MAKSFLSSSVVSGQKAVLYKRDMMYFSTWSITCSTDSEEPAEQCFLFFKKESLIALLLLFKETGQSANICERTLEVTG